MTPSALPAPELDRDAAAPVHVQIETWLTGAVESGKLAPGDRLPGERELAASLGVSRMTLRQALARLEARGVLVRVPGRAGGAFVADRRVDLDLTGVLGFTEHLRRANIRAGARVLSANTITADPFLARRLELTAGAEVHEVVRVRSAARAPVAVERSWFPAARFPDLLGQSLSGSLYSLLRKRYGTSPASADEWLDPVAADADSATLLGVAPGTPLMRVERSTREADGAVIEFARDLFRGDRVRLFVRSGPR